MKFVELLLRNHPLANILFAVVLVMGTLSYLQMPREQDPEINFNWVSIATTLPGASAEDVERRITQPLEDAIKNVTDIRFVLSSSRENVSSILVRFRDIAPRVFDKRVNDLRREVQNKAQAELPVEVRERVKSLALDLVGIALRARNQAESTGPMIAAAGRLGRPGLPRRRRQAQSGGPAGGLARGLPHAELSGRMRARRH